MNKVVRELLIDVGELMIKLAPFLGGALGLCLTLLPLWMMTFDIEPFWEKPDPPPAIAPPSELTIAEFRRLALASAERDGTREGFLALLGQPIVAPQSSEATRLVFQCRDGMQVFIVTKALWDDGYVQILETEEHPLPGSGS